MPDIKEEVWDEFKHFHLLLDGYRDHETNDGLAIAAAILTLAAQIPNQTFGVEALVKMNDPFPRQPPTAAGVPIRDR